MNQLPRDPHMLVSYINTKLRDEYSSLSLLCESLDIKEEDLIYKLLKIDYRYDASTNQFK